MLSKYINLSPFWSSLSFFTVKRLLLISIIFIICFEIIARLAPVMIGKHVHRPFTTNQRNCIEACDSQGEKIYWLTNERGARGSLYNDQPFQIAVFGSSTSSNSLVTQNLTWPEQIKSNVDQNIHIDNFAIDGSGNKEIESILNNLIDNQQRYDAILIMDHFAHEERKVDDKNAFKDWGRITTDEFFIKSPILISKIFFDSINKIVDNNSILNKIKK